MDYKEQLKHPKWQKKRLEIMQRDSFKCRICGSDDKQLNVHHIIYCKEYEFAWDYDNNFLITICTECHENEHNFNQNEIAFDLLKKFIKLSNDYLSGIEFIDVRIFFLQRDEHYTEKEAIKMALLEYLRKL